MMPTIMEGADAMELVAQVEDFSASFLQPEQQRVILVANNRLMSEAKLREIAIAPEDILVQFNAPLLFELFREQPCHKVHLFNANSEGAWWGFPKDSIPEHYYSGQAHASCTLLFTRWISEAVKRYLAGKPGLSGGSFEPQRHLPNFTYPAKKIPTVGFSGVAYFRHVNVLRRLLKLPPLQLVLLGFTGVYPRGGRWPGHDFDYEQQSYALWLDLERPDMMEQA